MNRHSVSLVSLLRLLPPAALVSCVATLSACPPPVIEDPPNGEGEGEGEAGEGEGEAGEGEGEGGEGEGEGEGESEGPSFPACDVVTGTNAVTFTHDEGATLAPTEGTLSGIGYTFGLVALDDSTLVAEHAGTFLRSTDAGCTWTEIGAAPASPMTMTVGGTHVYAWADNGTSMVRIDGTVITELTLPPGSIHGVGAQGDEVYVGMDNVIHHSKDAGATFDRGGAPATTGNDAGLLVYRTAFDPNDIDHAVMGTAISGAFVTFDAGETWTPATGTSTGNSNVFNAVISPADGDVVYAVALDLADNDTKGVYRSLDGGLTYARIVTESAEHVIVNGPVMAAHPSKAGVMYWVFGTFFQGYGTDVYRWDAATNEVTLTHNSYDEVGALVFSPADENLMYFGLVTEDIN